MELGDLDKAFEQLHAAYDTHGSAVTWLKVEPQFDALRSDPRYQELLQKLRFP